VSGGGGERRLGRGQVSIAAPWGLRRGSESPHREGQNRGGHESHCLLKCGGRRPYLGPDPPRNGPSPANQDLSPGGREMGLLSRPGMPYVESASENSPDPRKSSRRGQPGMSCGRRDLVILGPCGLREPVPGSTGVRSGGSLYMPVTLSPCAGVKLSGVGGAGLTGAGHLLRWPGISAGLGLLSEHPQTHMHVHTCIPHVLPICTLHTHTQMWCPTLLRAGGQAPWVLQVPSELSLSWKQRLKSAQVF
jgi:hypothetical protein